MTRAMQSIAILLLLAAAAACEQSPTRTEHVEIAWNTQPEPTPLDHASLVFLDKRAPETTSSTTRTATRVTTRTATRETRTATRATRTATRATTRPPRPTDRPARHVFKLENFVDGYKDLHGAADTKSSASNRAVVDDPKGSGAKVLRVLYKKGSLTTNKSPSGGTTFYASPHPIQWSSAKHVELCYDVMFQDSFDFNLGGKLPGLFGGPKKACSNPPSCWSTRYMFRDNGRGEVFPSVRTSLQPASYCKTPPISRCSTGTGGVGDSIGRDSFKFVAGQWDTICQEVKLNDVGKNNGFIHITFNGDPRLNVTDMQIHNGVGFAGIVFHTFFGGTTKAWASPKDQYVYFKNVKVSQLD